MSGTTVSDQVKKLNDKKSLTFYQKLIDHVFTPMYLGQLIITLPDGKEMIYGRNQGGVCAQIKVINNVFFRKCVLFGDVGFGESYVDGDWESDDITKVIEWMITNVENHPTLMADNPKIKPVNFLKVLNNLLFLFRKNSFKGSRRNIREHYDLGNDFYKTFLDDSMTYSSAYFKNSAQSLQEAQYQKYEELCRKLSLKASDHVLEIGCGWGGFAVYAAKNFGCRVTSVTISKEQFNYALNRVLEEKLFDKVTIEFKDYRAIKGEYDKIVSIEMLEAVGHEYYKSYFSQCHRLLKKDGMLGIQVILSPDNRYESFRKNMDWIQKHIFPGSLLPSLAVIHRTINSTGNLNLYDYKDLTSHYVRTLNLWRDNFNGNLNRVHSLGFKEIFVRKWNYYLSYCEAAFKTRNIFVAQIVFARPNNSLLGGNV